MTEAETNSSSKNDSEINVQNIVKREAGGLRDSQVFSMDDGTAHGRNIKSRRDMMSQPLQKSLPWNFIASIGKKHGGIRLSDHTAYFHEASPCKVSLQG